MSDIPPVFASVLATGLLAGELSVDGAQRRLERTLGRRWFWARPLVLRFIAAFGGKTQPRHSDAVRFLAQDQRLRRDYWRYHAQIRIASWIPGPSIMQPVAAATPWNLPVIESLGELAQWLSISPGELDWFADLKALGNKVGNERLQHYRYRMVRKSTGAVRVIESPKVRLKEIQRRILSQILDQVPPHPAAHGFVKRRSPVTFARAHAGKSLVLRIDLQDFFPQFPASRAQAFFRTLGYPETVADVLGGICSNAVPQSAWKHRPAGIDPEPWSQARALYGSPHLPQGAPTSPALANAEAYRLDCRLTGLSESADASYTRYADDLAFSGEGGFARGVERFAAHVAAIALEEGFSINFHKTRIMRRGTRQSLAGLIVNDKPNLKRQDIQHLEAILFNCARFGVESQNREGLADFRAHLSGCVAYLEMINPVKGSRLRRMFKEIS